MNASKILTIILPGYSLHNKDWAEAVKKNIKVGHNVFVHPWRHWSGGSMSFKYEIEKIIQETDGAELNIIAKSVGTEICARFLLRKTNKIHKIILCGVPSVSPANAEVFSRAFADFTAKNIVVFQNVKDPFATFAEVKKFMQPVNPEIKVIEKPAHTHDYPYFGDFEDFLSR